MHLNVPPARKATVVPTAAAIACCKAIHHRPVKLSNTVRLPLVPASQHCSTGTAGHRKLLANDRVCTALFALLELYKSHSTQCKGAVCQPGAAVLRCGAHLVLRCGALSANGVVRTWSGAGPG